MQVVNANMLQSEIYQHLLCPASMHCYWGGLWITTMTKAAIEAVTEGFEWQNATAWRMPQGL